MKTTKLCVVFMILFSLFWGTACSSPRVDSSKAAFKLEAPVNIEQTTEFVSPATAIPTIRPIVSPTTTSTTAATTTVETTAAALEEHYISLYDVNMRSDPGENYDVITVVGQYSSLMGNGAAVSGWIPVSMDGVNGYIRHDFLQADNSAQYDQIQGLIGVNDSLSDIGISQPAADPVQNIELPDMNVQAEWTEAPAEIYVTEAEIYYTEPEVYYTEAELYYEETTAADVYGLVGQSVTVFITETGKKYHNDGCRHLAQSKIPISLDDAIARGLGPCSNCH